MQLMTKIDSELDEITRFFLEQETL